MGAQIKAVFLDKQAKAPEWNEAAHELRQKGGAALGRRLGLERKLLNGCLNLQLQGFGHHSRFITAGGLIG
ncbi:MAG: hypothetical protein JWR44_1387 [Hymenobacter sp.]|jgi:hypothetical protein|nr:hypothetical protein [Hymenobacter sp.]